MRNDLKDFKTRALARADVRREYDALSEEFNFLDTILNARATAKLTQAEMAARIGTTESAVARIESGRWLHSPVIAALNRYALALGYRLQLRLVKDRTLAVGPAGTRAKTVRGG